MNAGGIECTTIELVNSTIVENTTDGNCAGLRFSSSQAPANSHIRNSILYFNDAATSSTNPWLQQISHITLTSSSGSVKNCCIQDLTCVGLSCSGGLPLPGQNCFNDNPQFADLAAGDFRLVQCSPCLETGLINTTSDPLPADFGDLDADNDQSEATPLDLDLVTRVQGTIDLGPYERQPDCQADINGDGVVNGIDLGILLLNWSSPSSAPGCGGAIPCIADLNCDGPVDGVDLGILLNSFTEGGANPCPEGESLMGGGEDGEQMMSSAGTSIGQLVLTPELVDWLVNAEIGELWAWYQFAFGGSPGEQ